MEENTVIAIYHLQEAAIQYGRAGVRIIPLIPAKKLPTIKCWWERSTCDEELIKFFWNIGAYCPQSILRKLNAPVYRMMFALPNKHPQQTKLREAILKEEDLEGLRNHEYNIGIATGTVNQITVIDVDSKKNKDGSRGITNWEALRERYGDFDLGPIAGTPSNGEHCYLHYDPRFKTKANVFSDHLGIDIRNDGGLIVAPPSRVWKGNGDNSRLVQYQWKGGDSFYDFKRFLKPVPKVLITLLRQQERAEKQDQKPKKKPESDSKTLLRSNARACIRIVEQDHPGVVDGNRNDSCLVVCRKIVGKFRTLSLDEMLEALRSWNDRCDPPLSEKELTAKLTSTIRRRDSDEANGRQWAKPTPRKTSRGSGRRRIHLESSNRPLTRFPKDMVPEPTATLEVATDFLIENVPPTLDQIDLAARYLIHRFVALTKKERLKALETWFSFEAVSDDTRQRFTDTIERIKKIEKPIRFFEKNKSQAAGLGSKSCGAG